MSEYKSDAMLCVRQGCVLYKSGYRIHADRILPTNAGASAA